MMRRFPDIWDRQDGRACSRCLELWWKLSERDRDEMGLTWGQVVYRGKFHLLPGLHAKACDAKREE